MATNGAVLTGSNLRQLRERKQLTRAQISRKARIPYRTLMNFEQGRKKDLTEAESNRIQAALQADPESRAWPSNRTTRTRTPAADEATGIEQTAKIELLGGWLLDPAEGTLVPGDDAKVRVLSR